MELSCAYGFPKKLKDIRNTVLYVEKNNALHQYLEDCCFFTGEVNWQQYREIQMLASGKMFCSPLG